MPGIVTRTLPLFRPGSGVHAGATVPPDPPPPAPTGQIMWLIPNGTTQYHDAAMTQQSEGEDGNFIGGWADQTVNANHATQSTEASKPMWDTNIQNGLGMLYFDGVNDLMQANTLAAIMSGTDKAITIAMAYKDDSAAGDAGQGLWGFGRASTDTPFCYVSGNWNTATTIVAKTADDGGSATASLSLAPDNVIHILTVRINGTSVDAWLDGVAEVVGVALNVNATTLDTFAIANLVRTVAASLWFKGWIGEVMAWNDARSDVEIGVINTYLLWEWGL